MSTASILCCENRPEAQSAYCISIVRIYHANILMNVLLLLCQLLVRVLPGILDRGWIFGKERAAIFGLLPTSIDH